MPRPKHSRVVKRCNALKRWQTNRKNNSENQPSADTSARIQYTSVLNSVYDGSWLTRGHTSNIGTGCVIALLTGFVIDFEVVSKRCEECQQTKLALGEDTAECHFWYEGHRDFCSITHVGSSGSMEVKAAIKSWERSESIGFRYTSLLSDGDSKAFLELNKRKIYGSQVEIKREEYINHVSKRLGTALRKTVKDWRVKGVTLGSKKHGSLKEETIKKLTRYYANAIRKNKGDIEVMKTAIYAFSYLLIRSHNIKSAPLVKIPGVSISRKKLVERNQMLIKIG
ncbi:hypothetical protein AVEN_100880-1 [Araneus ventricosus]|uniref:Mutator-like transposase domain-containing protein n=1 Tax=Araneus ventricosus TaxID=182803 RepID=A0A4Y2AWB5_ARAVE|nr:hypothetical protein AVEN_100880-1 [Araneus ventricosus]